jgi:hypothetical protein
MMTSSSQPSTIDGACAAKQKRGAKLHYKDRSGVPAASDLLGRFSRIEGRLIDLGTLFMG